MLLFALFACGPENLDSRTWEGTVSEPHEVIRVHAETGNVVVRGTDAAETRIWGDVSFPAGATVTTEAVLVDGELRLGAECEACSWSFEIDVPRDVDLEIVLEDDGAIEIEDISGDVVAEIGGEGGLYAEEMGSAAFSGRVFDGPIHANFTGNASELDFETGRDGIISLFVDPGAWNLQTTESVRLDSVVHDPEATRTLRASSDNVVDVKGREYVEGL
jgi:hypothetical protein